MSDYKTRLGQYEKVAVGLCLNNRANDVIGEGITHEMFYDQSYIFL